MVGLGFLGLLLFQSTLFPSSPTRSLALWEHHSPRVLGRRMFLCTASFQLRWRVKLIPKGRIYWLSSCEFLYKLLWRLGRERPLLLFPLFCSTVCLAVWSPHLYTHIVLAKLWLVFSKVVGCYPGVSSAGVARLWLASCWVVECSSAAFSEDGGSSRDSTFECHMYNWNLPSLKIARAACFKCCVSITVVVPVIR